MKAIIINDHQPTFSHCSNGEFHFKCPGEEAPCCTHPNMPWFNKTLSETTTEDIELRVCRNEVITNEDTPLKVIELFIR